MKRDRNYSESWFWAALAMWPGFLSALYLTGDPAMSIEVRNVILGTLGAAVGLSTAIWLGYALHGQPASAQTQPPPQAGSPPPIVNQGPGNAYSVEQKGGITVGTVTIAPPRIGFNRQTAGDLMARMPDKGKPIMLNVVGASPDQLIGEEYIKFYEDNGYKVLYGKTDGLFSSHSNRHFDFNEGQEMYYLTISPSAH